MSGLNSDREINDKTQINLSDKLNMKAAIISSPRYYVVDKAMSVVGPYQ